MKISPNFSAFKISSKGMSIQKKKMELITENIANTSTTKTADGSPYKRKYISVIQEKEAFNNRNSLPAIKSGFALNSLKSNGIENFDPELNVRVNEHSDNTEGDLIYMPDHPDSNEEGYVQMPNVNVVTEMVNMISASRSFEANVTAFNAAKQMAKDSLEI